MQRSVRRRRPAGSCKALSHDVSYFVVAYMFASFSIKPQLVVAHRPVLFFPFCFHSFLRFLSSCTLTISYSFSTIHTYQHKQKDQQGEIRCLRLKTYRASVRIASAAVEYVTSRLVVDALGVVPQILQDLFFFSVLLLCTRSE